MSKNLENEIARIMSVYTEEVTESVDRAALLVANSTVKILKETSPKLTGKYAGGWGRVKSGKTGYIVRQRAKPGLTHLLEKGHAKTGGGRVAPVVHIEPAEEHAIKEFEDRIIAAIMGSANI